MNIINQDQYIKFRKELIFSGRKTEDGLVLICANKLCRHLKEQNSKSFLFVIGPGFTGNVGIIAANQMKSLGYVIETIYFNQNDKYNLDETICKHVNVRESLKSLNDFRYIVDCIYGCDENNEIAYPFDAIIDAINKTRHFVISCDMPSGLNVDNGQISNLAIQANITVTFQNAKLGQFLYPGNLNCGRLIIETIDDNIATIESKYHFLNFEQISHMIPERIEHSHKGTYGKVLAILGSENMTGSAFLSCYTMMKTGTGLLTLFSYKPVLDVIKNHLPEAMTIQIDEDNLEYQLSMFDFSKYDLIVIGSGLSKNNNTKILLRTVLTTNIPVVVDGDALSYVKEYKYLLNRSQVTVITPHLGEYKRIFDYNQATLIDDLHNINKKYPNLVVVLKSERTIISYRDEIYFNVVGNNALAKAGTGDVLCGNIASFMAQRMNIESILAAVFIHSYAADQYIKKYSAYSLLASELINYIDGIMQTLLKQKQRSN